MLYIFYEFIEARMESAENHFTKRKRKIEKTGGENVGWCGGTNPLLREGEG